MFIYLFSQCCRLALVALVESLTSKAELLENAEQNVLPLGDSVWPD